MYMFSAYIDIDLDIDIDVDIAREDSSLAVFTYYRAKHMQGSFIYLHP